MGDNQFKYFAFISYNSKDTEWGKKVQRKLEGYRMPATLCSEHGWERKPIKPVFFAPTDIQPGGLTAELQERLKASRNLIVICSPNSAKSQWVGKEIEYFHSLGRTNNIHFFIVDGIPHSGNEDTECLNPIIETLGLPEILGANIHEKVSQWPWINKERAYIQLITKLLGIEFDELWHRHRRMLVERCVAWTIGFIAILLCFAFVIKNTLPFNSEIKLFEASEKVEDLPAPPAIYLTMTLDNEIKHDTLCCSFDVPSTITNIPHRYFGKKVRLQVECRDYYAIDTIVLCEKNISLPIYRDPKPYGKINFRLWNAEKEEVVPNVKVVLNNKFEFKSNAEGIVEGQIPLQYQKTTYFVSSEGVEIESTNEEGSILYMPLTESSVIIVK